MNKKKDYQMKRRRYGWGWIPTTWQSWLYLILQFGIILIATTGLPAKPAQPSPRQLLTFFAILILVIASLVLVSYMTGPKPHWRWGKKAGDNSKEDF